MKMELFSKKYAYPVNLSLYHGIKGKETKQINDIRYETRKMVYLESR